MYQNFSITGVNPDFAKNQIVVQASLDVEKDSVNDNTVELFSKTDGTYVNIEFKVDGKYIYVIIKNEIVLNSEYILRISKIKNILGEVMVSGIRRKIVFETEIKEIPTIISPNNYEVIEDLKISLNVDGKSSITSLKDKSYFIQIADDVAFIDIKLETTISEDNTTLKDLEPGQYFIRARVIKNKEVGLWSDTETFILKAKKEIDCKACCQTEDPEYIQYVSVIAFPSNGETPEDIVIEFDGEIDPSSLQEITIIRRDI